jgi:molybdopterin converting factor small subunit
VRVAVRLNAGLADRLGARRTVELPAGATAADLIERLAVEAGLDASAAGGLAVVAGGRYVGRAAPLRDGDELAVMVPVAGG